MPSAETQCQPFILRPTQNPNDLPSLPLKMYTFHTPGSSPPRGIPAVGTVAGIPGAASV